MASKIVFITQFPAAADSARQLAPAGFDLVITDAHSEEYGEALNDAEYLVGFVDMLVDEELYRIGPNLKLIQLLSAGYDRADIKAARRAGASRNHDSRGRRRGRHGLRRRGDRPS